MSEKKRLFKIAQSKELEQLNRQPNTLGSGDSINYALQFTGDTNSATRRGDLVVTDFKPASSFVISLAKRERSASASINPMWQRID